VCTGKSLQGLIVSCTKSMSRLAAEDTMTLSDHPVALLVPIHNTASGRQHTATALLTKMRAGLYTYLASTDASTYCSFRCPHRMKHAQSSPLSLWRASRTYSVLHFD
jgi:hypothetical protein